MTYDSKDVPPDGCTLCRCNEFVQAPAVERKGGEEEQVITCSICLHIYSSENRACPVCIERYATERMQADLMEVHKTCNTLGISYGDTTGRAYSAGERVKMLAKLAEERVVRPKMIRPDWDKSWFTSIRKHITDNNDPSRTHMYRGYACNGCSTPLTTEAALRDHWQQGHFDTPEHDVLMKEERTTFILVNPLADEIAVAVLATLREVSDTAIKMHDADPDHPRIRLYEFDGRDAKLVGELYREWGFPINPANCWRPARRR